MMLKTHKEIHLLSKSSGEPVGVTMSRKYLAGGINGNSHKVISFAA
jgi:hypothetical protein